MKQLCFLYFCLLTKGLIGQNEMDLYRYSRTTFNGSARFEAMAGAFGALGADLSSAQFNPAGMGRYSSSKAELTLNSGVSANQSQFNGQTTHENNAFGGISTVGAVITTDASTESRGTLYRQFSFGMNRIESFRNTFRYEGQQYSSLLDGFASQATGTEPGSLNDYFPFSTFLAYQTYALNYYAPTQSYVSLLNNGDVYHDRAVRTAGGQNELFIGYSFNHLNKLYFGANIGFRHHRYDESIKHIEYLTDTSGTPLRSFEYNYTLKTSGWGTNLRLGVIYLFSEALRGGLAIHSPTYGELTDYWSATMSSHFEDSTSTVPGELVPTGDYKYRIRNPLRIVGSMAYVAGTRGCLNLDLEYLDYRTAHFKSTTDQTYLPYSYTVENDYAKTVFKPALNARLGGEYILASVIYLRAGIAYYARAFDTAAQVENSGDFIFSTGAGIKTKRFHADLAYRIRTSNRNYYAFYASETQVRTQLHQLSLSLGINF